MVVAALSLLMALMVTGARAQSSDCGDFLRTSQITRGMLGTGLTVVQGTEPQEFDVEVLGVLENGVAVGRDMIIVEVNAPFLDEAGGIWQGMSGSPVYAANGAFMGAVAYGLSFVSTNIGGLTPAEDMVDLVDLPDGDPSFAAAAANDEIVVTGDLARDIRARTGQASFDQREGGDSVSFSRLRLPLSVSGLAPERLDEVQERADARGLSVTTTPGSAADFDQVSTTTDYPDPGDNLAVAQSYGDVTFAAVGTTTLNCDGKVVGFGHPFSFSGETLAGASTADAITIIPDPGFAPFKLANIEQVFGTIDQDRLGGVRGRNGDIPDTTPIRSHVADLDTGSSRDGRTDVVLLDAIADLALFHLLSNTDSVIDRIGAGSSSLSFTVTGSGSESGPFTMTRDNVFASTFDISFDQVLEMANQVFTLQSFNGEDVTIDEITIDNDVEEAVNAYNIAEVRVGVDGAPPEPSTGVDLLVQPGATITFEVDLVGVDDDAARTETIVMTIPEDAFGFGFLNLTGGPATEFFPGECDFNPEACPDAETVQELAAELAATPRNDELTAELSLEAIVPPEEGEEGVATEEAVPFEEGPQYAQFGEPIIAKVQTDRVVQGFFGVGVQIDSPVCPSCPPIFARVAGDDRIGTSVATSGFGFGFANTVVITPAGDYPYALVAGPLASREFAPILLSDDTALPAAVSDQIRALGATRAILVAPDGQLGGTIEQDLASAGITTVERVGGADRFAVAANVATRLGGTRAWLVEGENADPARGWPDAMSVAPVAGYEGVPILLTRRDDLPGPTSDVITSMGITDISIGGGTAAVGDGVEQGLVGRGITVERVAGSSRYDTSRLLAERQLALGASPFNLWLVTGNAFPDGLSAAPAVVNTFGTMLMVDGTDITNSVASAEFLQSLQYYAPQVVFVGGFAAISQEVEEQVFAILTGTGGGGGEEPGGPAEDPGPIDEPAPEPTG